MFRLLLWDVIICVSSGREIAMRVFERTRCMQSACWWANSLQFHGYNTLQIHKCYKRNPSQENGICSLSRCISMKFWVQVQTALTPPKGAFRGAGWGGEFRETAGYSLILWYSTTIPADKDATARALPKASLSGAAEEGGREKWREEEALFKKKKKSKDFKCLWQHCLHQKGKRGRGRKGVERQMEQIKCERGGNRAEKTEQGGNELYNELCYWTTTNSSWFPVKFIPTWEVNLQKVRLQENGLKQRFKEPTQAKINVADLLTQCFLSILV